MIELTNEQKEVAGRITRHLKEKGYAVLSGIGGSG